MFPWLHRKCTHKIKLDDKAFFCKKCGEVLQLKVQRPKWDDLLKGTKQNAKNNLDQWFDLEVLGV